jgi:hypothetical protein
VGGYIRALKRFGRIHGLPTGFHGVESIDEPVEFGVGKFLTGEIVAAGGPASTGDDPFAAIFGQVLGVIAENAVKTEGADLLAGHGTGDTGEPAPNRV